MSSAFQQNTTPDIEPEPQSFWVPPLHPLEPREIALPGPDQIGVAIVQPYISCFSTNEHFDERHFIKALQVAVSGVIWEIPALAGRVEWADEARHRIKVVIPENPTCEVRVKWMLEHDAQELEKDHWPLQIMNHDEMCLQATPPSAVGTYNFGVQANIIRGGLILTLHNNHVILDGAAQCLLMAVFAHHLSRAMEKKEPTLSELIQPEALDKTHAFGSHPAKPILEWKDIKKVEKLPAEEARAAFFQRIMNNKMTGWQISSENQKRMQKYYQDPNQPKLSQASIMGIWIWRCVTRARRLAADAPTRLIMPVQTRGRVEDLNDYYVGNALVFSRAKATAWEVENVGSNELGQRIAKSIDWWTEDRIKEFWGSIEECDDIHNYENSCSSSREDPGTDFEITNMTNFPYYHLKFGKGLLLQRYRQVNIPFTSGWSGFTPRMRDGTLEMFLFMTRDTLLRIMHDPEFNEFAEWVVANDDEIGPLAAKIAKNKKPRAKL